MPPPTPHPGDPRVVVAAAVVDDASPRRVLAAQRSSPPDLAGRWELPGGKVEPGESEAAALVRECREELGVTVRVLRRIGPQVATAGLHGVLRTYLVALEAGTPQPRVHRELRWVGADDIAGLDWLEPDRPVVAALAAELRAAPPAPGGAAAPTT